MADYFDAVSRSSLPLRWEAVAALLVVFYLASYLLYRRALTMFRAQSYIVGDTWKDTWAGRSAGCGSIILDRPYNRDDPADARVPNLTSEVDLIRRNH